MKNSIKVTIPFSFKGINYEPSCIIDLDTFILGDQSIESIYHIVASQNNIGNYSYEHEVLESSDLVFSEPTGIAHEFLHNGNFDLDGFKLRQNEEGIFEKLQAIAAEVLNIDNLEDTDNKLIKKALLKAYHTGFEKNDKKKTH